MSQYNNHRDVARYLHHWLRPLLGLSLFVAALVALDLQLKQHTLGEVLEQTRSIPPLHLLLALLCTASSYLAMTGYDLVALRHLGNRLRYGRIALTSFIAYVFSMDLGMSVMGSSAVRYRLYSGFGVEAGDVARVIALTMLALLGDKQFLLNEAVTALRHNAPCNRRVAPCTIGQPVHPCLRRSPVTPPSRQVARSLASR